MVINAKFMSKCPKCNGNILAGDQVEWKKGQRVYHVECGEMTIKAIIDKFNITHKSGRIDYVKEENDLYYFNWTRKDGKIKEVIYYKNGDRYIEGKHKTWLGVRNTGISR